MQFTTRLLSIALAFFTLTACDADTDALPMEGSGHAVATLRMVNYPGVTAQYLRSEAGLSKRQAQAVIAYRDGADSRPVTADDDTFDTIRELNLVIDAATIAKVVTVALERGWMPHEDAFLGVYDNVAFEVSEAELVLDIVNDATFAELDDDAGLHSNVADALIAGRPFHSIERIAFLPKMGTVNMGKLKSYAMAMGSNGTAPGRL